MKKKNWLLTIAFAVLALTIVSTTVLGGTYAKFVSTVSGGARAQAAGFLVTGSTTNATAGLMVAPGVSQNVSVTIDYFSQVETQISVANTNNASLNTGAFSADNWATLRSFYIAHIDAIKALYGISETPENAVTAETTVGDLITVNATAGATDLAAAIYAAGYSATEESNVWSDVYDSTNAADRLPAMKATATTSVSGSVNVTVTWVNGKYGDAFDTFVGNCIAALAKASASGNVSVLTITDQIGSEETATAKTLTLVASEANVLSYVNTNIAVTAQQYIAPATQSEQQEP